MTPIILAVTTVIYFFTESKNSQKQKSSIVMKFQKFGKSRNFEIWKFRYYSLKLLTFLISEIFEKMLIIPMLIISKLFEIQKISGNFKNFIIIELFCFCEFFDSVKNKWPSWQRERMVSFLRHRIAIRGHESVVRKKHNILTIIKKQVYIFEAFPLNPHFRYCP